MSDRNRVQELMREILVFGKEPSKGNVKISSGKLRQILIYLPSQNTLILIVQEWKFDCRRLGVLHFSESFEKLLNQDKDFSIR